MDTITSFFESILGEYSPVMYTDYIELADGTLQSVEKFGSPDYQYILSALLFIVVLYSILRIVGGVVCRK